MDKKRFYESLKLVMNNEREKKGIGTLGEKTLHTILKHYFEPDTDSHETAIDGYVADIVNEKGVIEIQTAGFNKLRKKLACFLKNRPVTLIYPIPHQKWLIWRDMHTGELTKKRKSPKKGTPYQAFFELYKIKSLLKSNNLKLRIVMLDMEEYRNLNGWSYDKKKGSSRYERIPTDIVDEICIDHIVDFRKLIPSGMPQQFTAKDFKQASGLSLRNAQTALNILHYIGTVERVGKSGNAHIYECPIITRS